MLRRCSPFGQRSWHQLVIVSVVTTALAWSLSQLPVLAASSATLAPAVLILSATLFGAVPVLINAVVMTVLHAVSGSLTPVFCTEALTVLAAAWLLRSSQGAGAGVLVYAAARIGVLMLHAPAIADITLHQFSTEVAVAVLDFAVATLALSWLPRGSRWLSRVPRRSLARLVFSVATVTSLTLLLIFFRSAGANYAAQADSSLMLLLASIAAVITSAAVAHTVARSIGHINAGSLIMPAGARERRRTSFRNTYAEAARVALRSVRRLYHLRRIMQRLTRDLSTARSEQIRQRTEVATLNTKLQEQAQVQQREVSSLQDLGKKLQETQAAIEHVRHNHKLFIAMMSHEVRTPLHGLMSTLSLMREESLSSEGERQLAIARTSARALLKIANDILDLSRIEAGGFSFEIKPFNPRHLIDEIIAEFHATAQAQKLEIGARTADDVPTALLGDRDRIYQIVSNLVSNAVKFTPSGSVTVRTSYVEGRLLVDVVDTGQGIAHDKRESIFDSFVQADLSSSRRFTGSGLGLTIGRHLAEAMGGSLKLLQTGQSSVRATGEGIPRETGRGGSTFQLDLALERSEEPALEEQSQRILAHPTGHILVVEDNDVNQYIARVMLESLDCTVSIVDNGAAALEAVGRERFDLVLMDCELPGIDGYEASTRLRREIGLTIPIIAMTANALPADRERARQAGMDDYLTKPFSKAALSRLLSQWLPTSGDSGGAEAWPVLDLSVLQELWESVGWRTSALRKIYDSFTTNVRAAVHLLATDHPPLPQVRRALHTIRGSGGMVGAMRIVRTAAQLEQALAADQFTRAVIDSADMARALREFEAAVEQRLSTHADVQPRR